MTTPHTSPELIVGIDLGTTNSLVAIADGAHGGEQGAVNPCGARILADEQGRASLPSVVRLTFDARVEAIGHDARDQAADFPERTIASIKRLMGRSVRDAHADLPYLSYAVVEGERDTARVRLPMRDDAEKADGMIVSPQEISAMILRALKDRASRTLGCDVHKAVVTVPAYFDDAQRQATRDAGRLAGLEVVRIVNEPTAAALAYGIGVRQRTAETIAVFDLGGGTFDVSILRVTPATPSETENRGKIDGTDFFQVLSTVGDTRLGGDDIDRLLLDALLQDLANEAGQTVSRTPAAVRALTDLVEQAKIHLSDEAEATIELDLTDADTDSGAHKASLFRWTLTREMFDVLIEPIVARSIRACQRALRDAKISPVDINRVVMVGGSTRIPLVRARVGAFFDVEPYTAVNPDEVVALGAALQGAILAGDMVEALLLDVIPLSLGIETVGGAVAKLVIRNSTVPARATEMFSTSVDGQTSIQLHVVQGEREMVEDCRSLGEFHLRNIPPMPAGIPQLEVEFLVDANGVLNVSAVEKRSGKRAALQVIPNHGLSHDEIDRMERESFTHAREDLAQHRIADLIANARLDVNWIRTRLAQIGGALDAGYRTTLGAKATELEDMIARAADDWQSVDADTFHRLKEELDRLSVTMHEVSIAESLRRDVPDTP